MKSNFGIFPSTFLPFGGIVLAGKAREVRWFHQTFRGKSPTKCFWNGWLFSANLDLKGNLDQVVLEDIVVKALPRYIYKRIIHEYVFHTSPLLIIVIIVIFMNMLFIPHHPYMDQVLQAVASVDIGGRSEENPGWENGSSRHCDSPFHKRSRETIIEWTWKASSPQLDWLGRAAWY